MLKDRRKGCCEGQNKIAGTGPVAGIVGNAVNESRLEVTGGTSESAERAQETGRSFRVASAEPSNYPSQVMGSANL